MRACCILYFALVAASTKLDMLRRTRRGRNFPVRRNLIFLRFREIVEVDAFGFGASVERTGADAPDQVGGEDSSL